MGPAAESMGRHQRAPLEVAQRFSRTIWLLLKATPRTSTVL